MTLRGLLYNTGWLTEDDSMRHHYLARITPWDTLTRRGRLNEGDSTRVTRRGDDSKRTTRRIRLGEDHTTKQDDSTRLLWVITRIPEVVRVVCEGHLFCELCWRAYLFIFFSIIWNVEPIINYIYRQSIVLLIIDTFIKFLFGCFISLINPLFSILKFHFIFIYIIIICTS